MVLFFFLFSSHVSCPNAIISLQFSNFFLAKFNHSFLDNEQNERGTLKDHYLQMDGRIRFVFFMTETSGLCAKWLLNFLNYEVPAPPYLKKLTFH